jgi:hypothetical protein
MEKMIGFCGINCAECPTFIATQKDDDEERKKVAETWSKEYGADLKLEDINCDGCQTRNGREFGHTKICEIRKCGLEKDVKNCAHCEEYQCEKLDKFFKEAPICKDLLEEIRKGL